VSEHPLMNAVGPASADRTRPGRTGSCRRCWHRPCTSPAR
jgi:hypothetical protein